MNNRKYFRITIILVLVLGIIIAVNLAYTSYSKNQKKQIVIKNIEEFDDFDGANLDNKSSVTLKCSGSDVGIIGSQSTCHYEGSIKYTFDENQKKEIYSKIDDWLVSKGYDKKICVLSYDTSNKFIVSSTAEALKKCGSDNSVDFSIYKIYEDNFKLSTNGLSITFRSPVVSVCNSVGEKCNQ